MYHPIDAIFKQPIDRYTVIYQNGKLWQLPRLDFNGQSLARKKPYTGSREQIFVASSQQLNPNDLLLISQIATIDLPASIVGRNVDQFETWWRTHSIDYQTEIEASRQRQRDARQQLKQRLPQPQFDTASQATASPITLPPVAQPTITSTAPSTVPSVVASATPARSSDDTVNNMGNATHANSAHDDIFDQMLADLTNDL